MKKFKSKFFCVAVEGATTDGRQIERDWIDQMASSYNTATYGARVWIEHMRSLLPDSPFRAYGDVTAVKAEEITVDGAKKLALFAQIEPTNDLVNIVNNLKQKLYTSIEVSPKFADSGKAYLIGLAVTDSPASIGTSMLAFAAQHPDENPLAGRKQAKENLFTALSETAISLEEVVEAPAAPTLLSRVKQLLGTAPAPKPEPQPERDTNFAALGEALEEVAQAQATQGEQLTGLRDEYRTTAAALAKLQQEFAELHTQLSNQPDPTQGTRPALAGGGATILTDC